MKNLLTFQEVEKKFGVAKQTLKKMLKEGNLPEAEKIYRSDEWVWVLPEGSVTVSAQDTEAVFDLREQELATNKEEHSKKVETPQIEPEQNQKLASVRHLSLASSHPAAALLRDSTELSPFEQQSVEEVIDRVLLDKLLGAQEAKAEALARAEQAEYALEISKTNFSLVEEELRTERKEHSSTQDTLREQTAQRKIAQSQIVDLNENLIREINQTEKERKQTEQKNEEVREEKRKSEIAFSVMGWRARRRYKKILEK